MRVVMVSKALVVGAYQRKLEELAKLPDIELTAVVPPGWEDPAGPAVLDLAYTSGYELAVAPIVFNGQYHLHFYPTLRKLLLGLRPDVLHMDEEPYNLATWHALRIGAQVGAKSLFFTWQNLSRRYPWPFRRFEADNYRRASYAIAGNSDAAGVLLAKGYSGRLAVIPQFGIDPSIFSPALPGQRPSSSLNYGGQTGEAGIPPFIIGYAGRLVPEKGLDVLLRASARLPFRCWRLQLLGTGPEAGRIASLAQDLGIADQVQILGRLPSTRVVGFYRDLDVFVLPSRRRPNWTEQFGRVLVEAMACEVPVIGSDCGEIPHVIGNAGVMVPEGDPEALGSVLSQLAADSGLRRELGRRGRKRVLDRYTHARIAEATAQVYREMLSQ